MALAVRVHAGMPVHLIVAQNLRHVQDSDLLLGGDFVDLLRYHAVADTFLRPLKQWRCTRCLGTDKLLRAGNVRMAFIKLGTARQWTPDRRGVLACLFNLAQ